MRALEGQWHNEEQPLKSMLLRVSDDTGSLHTTFAGRISRVPYSHDNDIVASLVAHPVPLVLLLPLQIHTLFEALIHDFLDNLEV